MNRTIIISDIHGCIDEFNELLDNVRFNRNSDQLILLGDYVDRGPASKDVVERTMELVLQDNAIALRGNHDQRLVDLVLGDEAAVKAKFREHGGLQTLQSYIGFTGTEITDEAIHQARERIGHAYGRHIEFLRRLPLYYEDDAHIYVHAGLNPNYPNWKEQPERDFMYIKGDFYLHRTHVDKKVVFGHSRAEEIHRKSDVWFAEDKIGIDGGCAYGQQLNALIVENGSYLTERVSSKQIRR
ncbi:metallophosphoesterase family protein [Cohnella panacarvi]|uniref:metallophosphoesterase family protein n=1 Tax=Cohnella panacarvi TaxID=400776 RepID=UPI00047D6E5E|nr:metallophosphoesterase family protein [Cohnella panacarvi]